MRKHFEYRDKKRREQIFNAIENNKKKVHDEILLNVKEDIAYETYAKPERVGHIGGREKIKRLKIPKSQGRPGSFFEHVKDSMVVARVANIFQTLQVQEFMRQMGNIRRSFRKAREQRATPSEASLETYITLNHTKSEIETDLENTLSSIHILK